MGRRGSILATLAALAALAAGSVAPPACAGGPRQRHFVVSYLVCASSDSTAYAPFEGIPSTAVDRYPWQWRIYDPVNKRDTLFLVLPAFPTCTRWDSTCAKVQYILDDHIEQADWRFGASRQKLASLPQDSSVCDFWFDPSGGLHVLTQREIPQPAPPGYASSINVATRWDMTERGQWHVAIVDTGGDSYGGCFSSERLESGAPRVGVVSNADLLEQMGIGSHRWVNSPKTQTEGEDDQGDWWIRVQSDYDSSIVLELLASEGDFVHAHEPVYWLRPEGDARKELYGRGESHNDALGQLAFGEREGYVLVVSEFSGAFPAVADLRSGDVVFRENRLSARGVWVSAPR
jgi:hypothetical protein